MGRGPPSNHLRGITMDTQSVPYQDDKLVTRWRMPNGDMRSKGKRVSRDCPLTREEIRVYVEQGSVAATKAVMVGRKVSLSEAWELIKKARGHN